MKAIRLYNYGSSDAFKYEDAPIPEIRQDQVLVKVFATSINQLDRLEASGSMSNSYHLQFPWIPGHDFAGIIESVGNEETGFKEGDEVYGNCKRGSYAEYVAVDADKLVKKTGEPVVCRSIIRTSCG